MGAVPGQGRLSMSIETFYFKNKPKNILHEILFDSKARDKANLLLGSEFTSSQFRNYFAEIRGLEARLSALLEKDQESGFDRILPYLRMVNAKLAYGQRQGKGRSKPTTSPEFAQFLGEAVNNVHDEQDFRAMVKYVEAVLAYFYFNETQKRGPGGRR
jgi:CRISPR-associated protein Csm2